LSVYAGIELRNEPRYQVELMAWLKLGQKTVLVRIDNLSCSGARIFMDCPPPCGAIAQLQIENFETLSVRIMRSGHCFCGVEFNNPAPHQRTLLEHLVHQAHAA
jgi:hypothetical protein